MGVEGMGVGEERLGKGHRKKDKARKEGTTG